MDRVDVVVAHSERATLRVGDVFVKVDADRARTDREVAAILPRSILLGARCRAPVRLRSWLHATWKWKPRLPWQESP